MRSRSLFDDLAFFSLTLLLLSLGCATPMTSTVDGVNSRSRGNIFSKSKEVVPKKRESHQRDLTVSRRKVDIKGQQVEPAFLDRLKKQKAKTESETSQLGRGGYRSASKESSRPSTSGSSELGVISKVNKEGARTKESRVAFKFSDSSLLKLSASPSVGRKAVVDPQPTRSNKRHRPIEKESLDSQPGSTEGSAASLPSGTPGVVLGASKQSSSSRTGTSSRSTAWVTRVQSDNSRAPAKDVVKASDRTPDGIAVKGYLTDQKNNIRAIIHTGANQTEIIAVGSRLAIGPKSELEIFEVDAIDSVVHLRNTLTKQRLIIK